jgi:hypothetical protein
MMSDVLFEAREEIEQGLARYEYMKPDSDYRRAVEAITYLMRHVTTTADADGCSSDVASAKRWEAVRLLVAAIDATRPEVERLDREAGDAHTAWVRAQRDPEAVH